MVRVIIDQHTHARSPAGSELSGFLVAFAVYDVLYCRRRAIITWDASRR